MNSPNHAYFNRLSQLSKAQSRYDRTMPPDYDCDLTGSDIGMLEELRVERIIDARESREREEW